MITKLQDIIIVDDDEDDILILQEAIYNQHPQTSLVAFTNADKMIEHLNSCSLLPDVLVLDLNMPRMNGKECLHLVKSNSKLSSIKVIIYSTSNIEAERKLCMDLGADYYVTKPNDLSSVVKFADAVATGTFSFNYV